MCESKNNSKKKKKKKKERKKRKENRKQIKHEFPGANMHWSDVDM